MRKLTINEILSNELHEWIMANTDQRTRDIMFCVYNYNNAYNIKRRIETNMPVNDYETELLGKVQTLIEKLKMPALDERRNCDNLYLCGDEVIKKENEKKEDAR